MINTLSPLRLSRTLLCALTLAAALTACDTDNEFHQTTFVPVQPNGLFFYADQTYDSIHVLTYDPIKVRPSAEWFSVSPEQAAPQSGYGLNQRIDIRFGANTTGRGREGRILVDGYDKIGMSVHQYPWLHIVFPEAQLKDNTAAFADLQATFSETLTADATSALFYFVTYAADATLSCNADWLTLPATTFEPGTHNLTLTCTPNTVTAERSATLTLTSGGVTTTVDIRQQAAPEE